MMLPDTKCCEFFPGDLSMEPFSLDNATVYLAQKFKHDQLNIAT